MKLTLGNPLAYQFNHQILYRQIANGRLKPEGLMDRQIKFDMYLLLRIHRVNQMYLRYFGTQNAPSSPKRQDPFLTLCSHSRLPARLTGRSTRTLPLALAPFLVR